MNKDHFKELLLRARANLEASKSAEAEQYAEPSR